MNEFAAYPQPVPGGYRVMMRFAKDGKPKPLMKGAEKPHVFPTREEAFEACTKHLLAYMNGDYRRDGDRAQSLKAAAEKLFVFRPGKTPVPVESVKRRVGR